VSYSVKSEFDRQRFEARIGALKGPGNVVDRHYKNEWHLRHPLLDEELDAYQEKMIADGYWKRCETCGKAFNPIYEHECEAVECQQPA
jgi:hypothetical protein